MLIDGGNVADSSLVVSYLDQQGIGQLDYVVCTHAHEDHVGGLSGPLNTCTAGHVLSPVTEYDSKAFEDFVKYTEAQGLEPEIPAPGDTFALGEAQVTVLGPVAEYSETNNTSIVLRVDFGATSFLFTGDMETKAEKDLLDQGTTCPPQSSRWATTAATPPPATPSCGRSCRSTPSSPWGWTTTTATPLTTCSAACGMRAPPCTAPISRAPSWR